MIHDSRSVIGNHCDPSVVKVEALGGNPNRHLEVDGGGDAVLMPSSVCDQSKAALKCFRKMSKYRSANC